MSRSLIEFRHAAFVYIAKVHSISWGKANGPKKKSVWGGAIRPCKSRIASRPSRTHSINYSETTVNSFLFNSLVVSYANRNGRVCLWIILLNMLPPKVGVYRQST